MKVQMNEKIPKKNQPSIVHYHIGKYGCGEVQIDAILSQANSSEMREWM